MDTNRNRALEPQIFVSQNALFRHFHELCQSDHLMLKIFVVISSAIFKIYFDMPLKFNIEAPICGENNVSFCHQAGAFFVGKEHVFD